MSRRGVIIISITANIILAVVLLALLRSPGAVAPAAAVAGKPVTAVAAAANPAVETNVVTLSFGGFKWGQLESAEYPVFIANLRGVGCPEKTIQDIVLPEIEGLYDRRREGLNRERDFWANGPERVKVNREQERQSAALTAEETAVIKELLGLDWVPRRRFDFDNQIGLFVYMLGNSITFAQAAEVATRFARFQKQWAEIEEAADPFPLPADVARLKALSGQFEKEVTALLSPLDVAEARLRLTCVKWCDDIRMNKENAFAFTPDELRAVAQMKAEGKDVIFESIGDPGSQTRAEEWQTLQNEKQFQAKLEKLLGKERYAQFTEGNEPEFQYFTKQNLPLATGHLVRQLQLTAQEQALEIQANAELKPSEKWRALQAVRATTEAALAGALDEKVLEGYRDDQGWWLKNLGRN